MNAPTISAVITTYNRSDKLLRCLKAVKAQTLSPLETIIVHDGSAADYSACITFIANEPSMRWVDQPNQGVSAARNHGVNLAHGEFIAFCDDDDYWLPPHIETLQSLILEHDSQPGIYHTHRREIQGSGWHDPDIHEKQANISWQEHYITQGEMIMCCTCMHRAALEFSPFPKGIKYAEDHEQRLIAMSKYPCFPSRKRTVVIDRTDESATNRSIHDIADIYRQRFDTMFAMPVIGQHIRRPFRHRARFRWTSLEISEARSKGTIPFVRQWLKATSQVRTWSNAKTMLLHVMWFLTQDLRKSNTK